MYTEAMDALAPWAGNLQLKESLASDVCLQAVKFILNPVLPLCHFLGSLARLGLGEFAIGSPLGFEPSLAHSLQLLANLSHRHSFFVLSLKCLLVLS